VKKADLIASCFAVFSGFVGIILGMMTNAGLWSALGLITVYFVGSVYLFFKSLSAEEQLNLETIEVSYGVKYWVPLVFGAMVSLGISTFYFVKYEARFMSAMLVGLGLMSVLTAFISPNYNEKTRLDNADEFG